MSQLDQDFLDDEDANDPSGDEDSVIVLAEPNSNRYNTSRTSSYRSQDDEPKEIDSEDEPDEEEGNWSKLPSTAVENIYSFLGRGDQSRMSQVCRRWSEDYHCPSLWKTVKFYLPEYDFPSEIYPEVRSAQKYGKMFRNVEVICKRVKQHLVAVILTQLKLFLQALASESRLKSIKFINMKGYFRFLDDHSYVDIFGDIVNFFQSQKHLETVEFRDCGFSRDEGVQILDILLEKSGDSLKFLFLKGFVQYTESGPFTQETLTMLSKIARQSITVHSVKIEYSRMFEEVMRTCQEVPDENYLLVRHKTKGLLSNLRLVCGVTRHSDCRGILMSSWKNLNKICPNLKIDLDVTLTSQARNEIDLFIVKYMRIKTLELRLEKPAATHRTDISYLFNHLVSCRCNDHLEALNVIWIPPIHNLAAALIPFLQACPLLETVQIYARYCSRGIENILRSLLDNRPTNLKSFTLWFGDVRNQDDEGYLAALSEEFYPLLQAIGIGVFLLVDPGRRLRRRNA